MKKIVSTLLTVTLIAITFSGCDLDLKKFDIDTSKYDVTTTSAEQPTTQVDESNDASGTSNKPSKSTSNGKDGNVGKTTNKTKNTNGPTTLYEGTTAYNGSSNLKKKKVDINYIQDGKQKTKTVTVVTGFENEMLAYVNNVRDKAHKNPLKMNTELRNAAIIRATESSVNWAHTRPDGSRCFTILAGTTFKDDIKNAGENLGKHQTSVEEVMDSWMKSKGHKENILSLTVDYNYVGFAWIITEDGQNYWAQMFTYIDR